MRAPFTILIVLTVLGCGEPDREATGSAAPPASPASAPATATSATDAAMASATATASAVVPPSLRGSWRGSYETKKAKVTIDPGVLEPSFIADNGQVASGRGALLLTIAEDGRVSGTMRGALGDAIVSGALEDEVLVATFHPRDAGAEPYMSGLVSARVDGGAMKGTLQSSSGDAVLARTGTVELTRE